MKNIWNILFSVQRILFIPQQKITDWIKSKRRSNAQSPRAKVVYDGDCCFCRSSIRLLQVMDLFGKIECESGHKGISEMLLVTPDGKTHGGFFAFRQLTLKLPMLYPMIPVVYFPGSGILGPVIYQWVARNRHVLPGLGADVKAGCRL